MNCGRDLNPTAVVSRRLRFGLREHATAGPHHDRRPTGRRDGWHLHVRRWCRRDPDQRRGLLRTWLTEHGRVGDHRHGRSRLPSTSARLARSADGGFVARPGVRSLAVGALLCLAGAATLASVGWGLKDQGLYYVGAMPIAPAAARVLASDSQRVCAASLPARTM